MNSLRLALRMLLRDWRAGELTVLALALILAVTALTAVSLLADRVQQGLLQQAHQILGGDLLLTADHPWSDGFRIEAKRRQLRLAESATFLSMVLVDGEARLVDIKAVSDSYPLRGALRIASSLADSDHGAGSPPAAGTAWPDERLAAAPITSLMVGGLSLRPAAVLTLDPERGLTAFSLAPRVIINLGDLAATGLVQPGSRIAWRLHVAGDGREIADFQSWLATRLGRGERMETLDNARPEMRNLLERSDRFLRLAALLTVVLAAVAVGLSADRYLRRHLDACAVMRCMGAGSRTIMIIFGGEFLLLACAATVVGCLLGGLGQWLLVAMLGGLVASDLPLPSWQPFAQGLAVALCLVGGFLLPPLLRLRHASTLRVLRREWVGGEPLPIAGYLLGLGSLALLMLWLAGDLKLATIIFAGFAAAVLVLGAAGLILLALLRRLAARAWRSWRLGLAGLQRRWRGTLSQLVALGLGLTAMLVLTVAREDLMATWQSRLPADAPNRFVINLQSEQKTAFEDFFRQEGLPPPRLEPMVRGRLVAVNGRSIRLDDYADERAQRLVEREFNLSWTTVLPRGNGVSQGTWFATDSAAQFSVEQGLAETLGLRLGDRLSYQVAGETLTAPITSLRKLDWDSMQVNFFVLAPPAALENFPASYITSFHLEPSRAGMTTNLVRAFPNISVIDVGMLLRQLRDTLDQVAHAIGLLFGLSWVAGIVVLYAGLQASADERQRELALMRALGARRGQLRRAMVGEFFVLGAVSGLLAGCAAAGLAYALGRWVFHLDYLPSPLLPVTGVLVGAVGVVLAGLWLTRDALNQPLTAELMSA